MKVLLALVIIIMISTNVKSQNWKAFHLEDIKAQKEEIGRLYYQFLDEPSLSMGFYVLGVGADDPQHPHDLDEIYYVVSGRAEIKVGDGNYQVQAGSLVFVRAMVPHKFYNITEELQTLVIFSKSKVDPEDPDGLAFDIEELRKAANNDENVWNQFIDVNTLRLGVYLLPKNLNGDQTLIHEVDEINIVTGGSSRFAMGDDDIEVHPGSVIWVKSGVEHNFHTLLDQDLEVLILFHKKN